MALQGPRFAKDGETRIIKQAGIILYLQRLFTPGVPDRLIVGATPLRDLYGRLPRDDRQRL